MIFELSSPNFGTIDITMPEFNESEIQTLLKGGEIAKRKAFEKIVNQFSEQLYWQIRHIVLSHEDSNDILQNTFIKAWTNIDAFQGNSKIYTWLYRIAVNEALTFLNKQRTMTFIEIDDSDVSIGDKLEGDPYFDGTETEKQLQEAIATLPEKQRIVFNMKYFDEMKYEDMSEILGTSVGALKASFHIAVKKIEDFFNNID